MSLIITLCSAPTTSAQIQQDFLIPKQTVEADPEALYRLGNRFTQEGKPEQAQIVYEQSIKLKPSTENLTALAQLYLSQGDEESWLKTMEQRLDLPFDRYKDAVTNRDIAEHFINQGEWEKALPYAEAAAMRGYVWAYNQAAWLNGALGHTQRGLEWMEQNAVFNLHDAISNYILAFNATPSEWSNQLLDYYYEMHRQGKVINRARCMSIALIREDYDAAVSLMDWGLKQSNDPWFGLHAALLCEEKGWMQRRDQILQDIVERWPRFPNPNQNRRNAKAFVDLYIQANLAGNLSHEVKTQLQVLFDTCGRTRSDFNGAYVGELFRLKNESETAKAMYSEIIAVKRHNNTSDYVAFRGLRLIGEDPVKILQEQRNKLIRQSELKGASQ
ncbi:hypothetical protein P4C99_08430 [Pontiellaceae bacterium B1224]|nr:hypothetical protein [Pontiellaceae bacterium B1224]